jgi:hydrogenase maturation protease
MSTETSNILFYGYGNPGRGDDGLGPALVAELEPLASAGLACESDYQLSVEDAATLAGYDVVVFVDADMQGPAPFWFDRVQPSRELSFSSHSATPGQVVALAAEMFGSQVKAYTLGIRGYQFGELCESLSDQARANLAAALAFAKNAVNEQHFDKYTKQFGVDSDRSSVCDPQLEA